MARFGLAFFSLVPQRKISVKKKALKNAKKLKTFGLFFEKILIVIDSAFVLSGGS
jgi:hypothetical protein